MSAYDEYLGEVHACPLGLTCRPSRAPLYPLPAEGTLAPEGPDILLVGWNPRQADAPRPGLPPLPTWREDARAALAGLPRREPHLAADLAGILPPTHALDSGRTMRTFLWKWPTRVKTAGGESAFYAQRCIRNHHERELALLRPRVVLAYHAEASEHFAARAESLGVEIREPAPRVRRAEALGWALTSDAWGRPMGLVLLRDAPAGARYDGMTVLWAAKALAHLLAHADTGRQL